MKIQVYAYDLTRGMAAALSPMLLGYQIEAVWHTAVVIDGRKEIFFGYGIAQARPGSTMFGQPMRVLDMGESEVTSEVLDDLLSDLAPRFRPQDYNLLFHNCNTFSNELVQLLTGESLPDYMMGQAQHLFNTPWGESLMPMIMAMEGFTAGATADGSPAPQQQQQQAAAPATPAPAAAAPAAAAAASSAAVAATTSAAQAAASSAAATVAATSPSRDVSEAAVPQEAAAQAASAAANAGMAAVARAARQSEQAAGASSSAGAGSSGAAPASAAGNAAAVGKAIDGVAGLSLTADSRAVQQEQQ